VVAWLIEDACDGTRTGQCLSRSRVLIETQPVSSRSGRVSGNDERSVPGNGHGLLLPIRGKLLSIKITVAQFMQPIFRLHGAET